MIDDKIEVVFDLETEDNSIIAELSNDSELLIEIDTTNEIVAEIDGGIGGGGTTNYELLSNKPQINNVELVGNTTLEELGVQTLEAGENVEIVNNVISVPTASEVDEDNTKPISASAVYREVGNISILLQTI